MTTNILRIDASARRTESVSRDLNDLIIKRYDDAGDVNVVTRDLTVALPQIDEAWVGANFTPADDRNDIQRAKLAQSDELVGELQTADVVLIGLPIYNFGMPAALKAWVDLIARAGVTFRYGENGPEGLLVGKRAIVSVASGGTEVGSDIDFATGHLRQVLKFVGITDVVFVKAERLAVDADGALKAAQTSVADLQIAA